MGAIFPPVASAHPGAHGEIRVAPNVQTEPLDVGTIPNIPDEEAVMLAVRVVDADSGSVLPHRVRITDAEGRYYPPEGHTELGELEGHVNNVTLEPDLINRGGRGWAMIEDGGFRARVRAIDGYAIRVAHGLEYERPVLGLNLKGMAGKTVEKIFKFRRGIDMQARGWMSADSHVHSLSPEGALRQMRVEDVDYTNLMFFGPDHPLFTRGLVTGSPDPVSTAERIVYVSQEVRDMNLGHMTLLGMRTPIEPARLYTGTGKTEPEPRANEPFNWEVTRRMHAQGGLAFHAHYLFWPGYGSAVGGALGLLDGLEWTSTDIVNSQRRTRQGLRIHGWDIRPTGVDSGLLYYRMLNCGARLPLLGGTDKMSAARPVGSVSRTYAKVDDWSHDGFMDSVRQGATFVTNGPLLSLTVDGQRVGSELRFEGEGPFTVEVDAECFSHRPINYIQLIQDGEVVHELREDDLPRENAFQFEARFEQSGWLALRAGHDESNPEDWWGYPMAAHTSPIYVTVDDSLPADEESARYLMARLDATLIWAEQGAIWSSPESKRSAMKAFREARAFYEAALNRALASDG